MFVLNLSGVSATYRESLKFNFSLSVLLRENLRPGRLHSLVIALPSPRPCATRPCRRRSGLPSYSLPPFVAMIPSPLVEVVWGVALGEFFTCESSSHCDISGI